MLLVGDLIKRWKSDAIVLRMGRRVMRSDCEALRERVRRCTYVVKEGWERGPHSDE